MAQAKVAAKVARKTKNMKAEAVPEAAVKSPTAEPAETQAAKAAKAAKTAQPSAGKAIKTTKAAAKKVAVKEAG